MTQEKIIVGIGHVSRVGKDVAATALCRDLQFTRVGFADQLKELALIANPIVSPGNSYVNRLDNTRLAWIVQSMGGWEQAKDTFKEVRPFLQRLGDGCRQVFGDDFWVKQVLDKAHTVGRLVIPDVRYMSEVQAIRARGGVVIKINRPGRVGSGHISETELSDWDGWDEVFDNDGTVQELQTEVSLWVKNVIETRAKVSEKELQRLDPTGSLRQAIVDNIMQPPLDLPEVEASGGARGADAPLDMDVLLHEAKQAQYLPEFGGYPNAREQQIGAMVDRWVANGTPVSEVIDTIMAVEPNVTVIDLVAPVPHDVAKAVVAKETAEIVAGTTTHLKPGESVGGITCVPARSDDQAA